MHRHVYGTARGFKGANLAYVKESLNRTMLAGNVTLDGEDNLSLLEHYRVLG